MGWLGSGLGGVSADKPEKLSHALNKEKHDVDCTPCRLVGGAAFLGLAVYTYASGMKEIERQRQAIIMSKSRFTVRGRQAGIAGTSMVLLWMGIYRLLG